MHQLELGPGSVVGGVRGGRRTWIVLPQNDTARAANNRTYNRHIFSGGGNGWQGGLGWKVANDILIVSELLTLRSQGIAERLGEGKLYGRSCSHGLKNNGSGCKRALSRTARLASELR
jgi:hypothetical protein